MPRNCGCAGNSCSCLIQEGPGVTVAGSGNSSDPYIIGLSAPGTGYLTYGPIDTPGWTVDLQGVIVGNTTVFIESDLDFTLSLPEDAPQGTQLTVIVALQPAADMAISVFGNTVRWPGGVDPVFDSPGAGVTYHMLRVVHAGGPGQWFGEALLNLAS